MKRITASVLTILTVLAFTGAPVFAEPIQLTPPYPCQDCPDYY